ncbi:ABC transporter permease [Dactylosporangium sp. AC04546]|uniref:ABC transporter permease n=1 Tax=Dactylosporangium sp. AC04546 TaxID=2862460 RepID=UPI001EDD6FA3|nr:ABC transporter permease [Dactylosporangium sp. AC04546]WVK88223.1 ABC transporter permease [Dactylosporangium sp. AC04546]
MIRDAWTIAGREFSQLRHQPGELVGALVFPAVMVVLFGYVFGSAIAVPGGGNYREYLMPGLFAMTAITGVMTSALAISRDVAQGVMDRFRSMPMARSAIPFGRTLADLVIAAVGVVIMAGIGLLAGWRVHHGMGPTLAGFALILLVRFAVSWIGVAAGLFVTPETADALVPIVFPISILSNSFVPTEGMPAWLRVLADWNPISALVAASRELFGNPTVAAHQAWPLQHPLVATLAWTIAILAVFVPLSTWRFQRAR